MTELTSGYGIAPGAWVRGTTLNDERIRGFVRHYDALTNMYTVTVVQSDSKEAVGRTVFTRANQIAELPVEGTQDADAIHSLIDLALSARDEAWFLELTAELLRLQSGEGQMLQTASS